MKLINQSYEIWEQDTNGDLLQGIYKQIERAGRVCYKSEDKITDSSAKDFVQRMIDSEHYAMLEHGTVYLELKEDFNSGKRNGHGYNMKEKYQANPYSKVNTRLDTNEKANYFYITTNFRVIIENGWQDDLQYLCAPTDYHAKRATIHLTTSRQVTHELVRHRTMSFAMESTRYCNYMLDKFGNELTFIHPCWLTAEPVLLEDPKYLEAKREFTNCLETIEATYCTLISNGWKPQQAAIILPNDLKAEIVVTGFLDDWKHLFDLRVLGTTGAPHPQMLEAMKPVYTDFIERGWV